MFLLLPYFPFTSYCWLMVGSINQLIYVILNKSIYFVAADIRRGNFWKSCGSRLIMNLQIYHVQNFTKYIFQKYESYIIRLLKNKNRLITLDVFVKLSSAFLQINSDKIFTNSSLIVSSRLLTFLNIKQTYN